MIERGGTNDVDVECKLCGKQLKAHPLYHSGIGESGHYETWIYAYSKVFGGKYAKYMDQWGDLNRKIIVCDECISNKNFIKFKEYQLFKMMQGDDHSNGDPVWGITRRFDKNWQGIDGGH